MLTKEDGGHPLRCVHGTDPKSEGLVVTWGGGVSPKGVRNTIPDVVLSLAEVTRQLSFSFPQASLAQL